MTFTPLSRRAFGLTTLASLATSPALAAGNGASSGAPSGAPTRAIKLPIAKTGPAAGLTITGLQNQAARSRRGSGATKPPLVIALHGGGFKSLYFDIPGYSLLEAAEQRGIPAIALDRPGSGGSTPLAPTAQIIAANAAVFNQVIGELWAQWSHKAAGVFLIGHSIGGAVVTDIAGLQPAWPLLGIAISGCLLKTTDGGPLPEIPMIALPPEAIDHGMFGPAGSFAADMPQACHVAMAPVPRAELVDIGTTWTARVRDVAARITVPVYSRQAELDSLWISTPEQVAQFEAAFTRSPKAQSRIVPGVGHAIDFHKVGAAFQAGQLDFAVQAAKRS